jgi:hypothetical protein
MFELLAPKQPLADQRVGVALELSVRCCDERQDTASRHSDPLERI